MVVEQHHVWLYFESIGAAEAKATDSKCWPEIAGHCRVMPLYVIRH